VFSRTFPVRIFPELNPSPKADELLPQTFDASDEAPRLLYVGGLDNGTGSANGLSLTATSSNPGLVPDPLVEYRPGDSHAYLVLSAPGEGTGEADIALAVTNAGAPGTNGPQTLTKTVKVLVRPDPVVDFVEEYNTPGDADGIARFPETENAHSLSLPSSAPGALQIDVKKDFVWAGLWYQLPREIDLSESLRVSVRMKASSPVTCRIFLMDHEKNYTAAAAGPVVEIGTGEFRDYVFDFRNHLAGSLGKPIDPSRITRILFNFDPGKPFHGTVWFDDLRIGKSARTPDVVPTATIDPLPDLYLVPNSGTQRIAITGVSDGLDGSREPALTATASDPKIVSNLTIVPGKFGTAELTFACSGAGEATVEVVAQCPGGAPGKATFSVAVVSPGAPANVLIDRQTRHQTIEGLGAYIASPGRSDITLTNPVRGAELAKDLGMSMARLGIIEADWEAANDNANAQAADFPMATDPAWLESARRLVRFKELSGVDRYIMSVWAPGAFSMKLKGRSCFGATSATGDTDQHAFSLNPAYLEEFGEHLAAWHHWLAERADIDIYATSLGNEVQFTQPYPSAVYGIRYYHRVWTALGQRLERDGLPPWQFGAEVLPEQNEVLPYLRPILDDLVAAKFVKALAYHGYAGLGVNPGSSDAQKLESYYEEMKPLGRGVWMTETSGNTDDWTGAYELGEAMFACLATGKNSAWVFWTFANNTDEGGYLLANRWMPGGRFYAVKQMMKHIRPGDTMLGASASDSVIEPAAFVSEDGKRNVLVLKNGGTDPRPVTAPDLGGPASVYQSAEHRHHVFLGEVKPGALILLPPKSFTTLVAGPAASGHAETPALYPRHASTGAPLRVQVTTPTDGAVIRYTIDGSDPTEESPVASNPMVLTTTTLLKTRAFKPGLAPSGVGGAHYQLGP
jgi:O-glycosyl hydrolase